MESVKDVLLKGTMGKKVITVNNWQLRETISEITSTHIPTLEKKPHYMVTGTSGFWSLVIKVLPKLKDSLKLPPEYEAEYWSTGTLYGTGDNLAVEYAWEFLRELIDSVEGDVPEDVLCSLNAINEQVEKATKKQIAEEVHATEERENRRRANIKVIDTKCFDFTTMDGNVWHFEGNKEMFDFFLKIANNSESEELISAIENGTSMSHSDDRKIHNDSMYKCVKDAWGNTDIWVYCLNSQVAKANISKSNEDINLIAPIIASLTHAMNREGISGLCLNDAWSITCQLELNNAKIALARLMENTK